MTHIDYLLHEHKQHGLEDHINKLMDSDIQYSLIILPDSSSNDYQYHESLKEINTPVLVLDHHITDTELSDNAVIINNQLSGGYKNKDLTGAGVTYQFCRYYDEKYGFNFANKYMDLAALGIIGDMGSMLNIENRYIVKNGLGNIKNVLLKTLAEKQAYSITGSSSASWNDIAKALNPVSVAFYIVPLINAVIRAGTAEEKERLFEAFLNGDEMIVSKKRGAAGTFDTRANEAARESGNIRNRQNKMLETVLAKTENKIAKYDLLTNRILFIRLEENEDFPSELNGLLAMKLSAQYKRPTIVARRCEDGINKGSMRGLNQSELRSFKEFLEKSGLFTLVAGHDNAAGCWIPDKNLKDFHNWADNELKNIDFGENSHDINFDRIAADEDISELVFDIGKYENIWGQGNQTPLIHISDINITQKDIKIMGKNMDTVKIEKFGISYMKFHAKEMIEELKLHDNIKLEIVGKANVNYWGGRATP